MQPAILACEVVDTRSDHRESAQPDEHGLIEQLGGVPPGDAESIRHLADRSDRETA